MLAGHVRQQAFHAIHTGLLLQIDLEVTREQAAALLPVYRDYCAKEAQLLSESALSLQTLREIHQACGARCCPGCRSWVPRFVCCVLLSVLQRAARRGASLQVQGSARWAVIEPGGQRGGGCSRVCLASLPHVALTWLPCCHGCADAQPAAVGP